MTLDQTLRYDRVVDLAGNDSLAGIARLVLAGSSVLDLGAANGVAFAPLAEQTEQKLQSLMSTGSVVGNPLDAGFAALTSQDAYLRAIELMLADPGVGLLLLQEELPRAPGTEPENESADGATVVWLPAPQVPPTAGRLFGGEDAIK